MLPLWETPSILNRITSWAAYPASQVLFRVCREPFRPLQFNLLYSHYRVKYSICQIF
nr:MAG TPA_asm: hypothetical protein [Caudoviricetes sp.]